ncbi:MAG: hypothetical protein KJ737_23100 [Proteobacteria bacterium]|nr:hypothetical protein [Pseudomonadota bacterium]
MRKHKTIKIDDREITVKELRVKDYITLFQFEEKKDPDLETILSQVKAILPKVVNIAVDDMLDMAPSEIDLIWNTFKEVNASFLGAAQKLGLEKIVAEIKSAILADFSLLAAGSLKQAT